MKYIKIIIYSITIGIVGYLLIVFINYYFGYYANHPWKRRIWSDNKNESLRRGVFVKDLECKSTISLDTLEIYIERGYRTDVRGYEYTNFFENTNFPYQIRHIHSKYKNKQIKFYLLNNNSVDSIENINNEFDYCRIMFGYLKEPKLKDTLYFKIKYALIEQDTSTLGYMKVWDTYNSVYDSIP